MNLWLGGCDSLRRMFSTMITVASTTSPKSIAPTDRRLADSPSKSSSPIATARANGIVAEVIKAARMLPRKMYYRTKIRIMPSAMLCKTVCVVTLIRSDRS